MLIYHSEQLILRDFFSLLLWKSVVRNKSWELALRELLQMLQYSKPSVLFCPFIYLFLRRVWLFSLGSPVKNQLFLLHIMTHRGKHAYRFAVFVFLQRAHHWAAFLLESDLSASAHFHSLLCRRKNIAKSLLFIFFSPKNTESILATPYATPLLQ